jgi:hypothetical protein
MLQVLMRHSRVGDRKRQDSLCPGLVFQADKFFCENVEHADATVQQWLRITSSTLELESSAQTDYFET